MNKRPNLDIDWLRSFVAVADAQSFTVAGSVLAATQSTISVRIRKLEERLGQRLLKRNPRLVEITPFGARFLEDARRLISVHDEVAMRVVGETGRITFHLAVSDHVAGGLLPSVLSDLKYKQPLTRFLVTVGLSSDLIDRFESGEFDAVIARQDDAQTDRTILFQDRLVWCASRSFRLNLSDPLPLISLGAPCSIRTIAIQALDDRDILWDDVFTCTGVAAVQAALSAGLGIACLEERNVPDDCATLDMQEGLPDLPRSKIVMLSRNSEPERVAIAHATAAAFRRSVGDRLS